MTLTKTSRVIVSTIALLLALAARCRRAAAQRHSGVIVDADEKAGTLVLAKLVCDSSVMCLRHHVVGPSRSLREPSLRSSSAPRMPTPGIPGDFLVTPLAVWAVYRRHHVTIECRLEGKRLIAVWFTVTTCRARSRDQTKGSEAAKPQVRRPHDPGRAPRLARL